MQIEPITVMIIFYFYLLARWQYVKRPFFYLIGALGLVFAFCGGFFVLSPTAGSGLQIVNRIFMLVGMLVSFVGAVTACFGAKLPGVETPIHGYQQQQP